MGDLHEIVDLTKVGHLFAILAIVGPVLGFGIGLMAGRGSANPKRRAIAGLMWGGITTLNWVMWKAFNAVTASNGIDTVRNLALNLVLFVIVGVVIGGVSARFRGRNVDVAGKEPTVPPETSVTNQK